jgi:rhodanese-related sulfurtransferase
MTTNVTPISRQSIEARLASDQDITLVEALGPMYYDAEHLPGALNLPHDQVDELAPGVLPDRDAFVVVYCANTPCPNSAIAAKRLVELGYTDVHEYVEGKQDWIEAGLPIEQTTTV